MAEQTDIVRATERFREKATEYDKAERYYRGDHDLAYATAKFQNAFGSLFKTFAMNLCPAVCDAVRDKLMITEFGVDSVDNGGGNTSIAEEAWKIWQANRMTLRAGEVHREALKAGEIAATSQQYPLKMAQMGVEAVVNYAKTGEKPSGYTDTGVTLITDNPQDGIPSEDSTFGTENCWG